MSRAINIPITVPESQIIVPHEEYKIRYSGIQAVVSIDSWYHCTEFSIPIDHERLKKVLGDHKSNSDRFHVLSENALVERVNHDIADITFHYRNALTDLLPFMKQDETTTSSIIGVRQRADMHVLCSIDRPIEIEHILHLYPHAKRLNGVFVSLNMNEIMATKKLNDGLSLFKFSVDEYKKMCENESLHRDYNAMIPSVIKVIDDQDDLSSVPHVKVCIHHTGQIIMTGPLNRRSVITATYNLLQAIESCIF